MLKNLPASTYHPWSKLLLHPVNLLRCPASLSPISSGGHHTRLCDTMLRTFLQVSNNGGYNFCVAWLTEYILYIGQYSQVQLSKQEYSSPWWPCTFIWYDSIYAGLRQAHKLGNLIPKFRKPNLRRVVKTADYHTIAEIMAKEHLVNARAVS